jgi:predicted metal-binding protein
MPPAAWEKVAIHATTGPSRSKRIAEVVQEQESVQKIKIKNVYCMEVLRRGYGATSILRKAICFGA